MLQRAWDWLSEAAETTFFVTVACLCVLGAAVGTAFLVVLHLILRWGILLLAFAGALWILRHFGLW